MAAAPSSSNPVPNPQTSTNPSLSPKQEPKLEPKQEPNQEPKQEPEQVFKAADVKEVKKEPMEEPANTMNSKERVERFQKYEADFKQYLMAKYFSDKTIYGGNIFDVKVNNDGQTTMASRLPPYQSFLDPATFEELNAKGSLAPTDIQGPGTSNGKPAI